MNIGENLRKIRKSKGMTQETLSNITKISITSIQRYELGKRQPNIEIITKFAEALEVPVDKILFNENDKIVMEKATKKVADHVVDDIYPLVEYVNQNKFQGKFNVKEVFSTPELIDLAGLIDDVVSNRLLHAVNKNK